MKHHTERDPAGATRAIVGVALLVFLLAAFCSPLSPLFDPDEGYYPATAAETLRSGAFWDLQFNDAPRWEKPILSYALIEASLSTFGETVAAARLPSAVEGSLLVLLIGLVVARLASPRAGFLTALVVGTSLGISIFSRVAHPELAVVTSVVTAELLFCIWLTTPSSEVRRWASLGAGVAIAVGVLAKGPVAAVLPFITMLAVLPLVRFPRTQLRSLAVASGLCATVAIGLASPWYAAMTVRHGVTFLRESLWQQNVGRYTTQMYGHRSGAGAMIVPTLVALFPWVGLLPQALIRVSTKNGGGRDILRTTMCVGAVVAFAFYSLSSSKLPSYALMLAPPLGVLIGLWLDDELDHAVPIRTVWMQTAILLGVVAMALMSAPLWAGHLLTARQLFGGMRPEQSDLRALLAPITLPLGCLVAAAAASVLAFRRPRRRILVVATLGASIPVLALLWAQPVLRSMYPWEVLGPEVQKDHGRLWLVGRRAPSLSFYARRSISTVSNEESLDGLVAHEREGWLVLTQEDWARFAATDAARRAHATLVDARGRMVLVRFKG